MASTFRAVIFDLGGVVVGSPLHAIARFEAERGIVAGAINRIVVGTGRDGDWSRLERGELDMEQFFDAFEADCAAAGVALSARDLMLDIAAVTAPRPVMVGAVRRIRSAGLRTGVITNNWKSEVEDESRDALQSLFDVYIESAVVGVRKPDPRIFQMACESLQVTPAESVFLDDIGLNLKAARALGMATIKVDEPGAALEELESLLGLKLLA